MATVLFKRMPESSASEESESEEMQKEWEIDRSRILDYQACPRRRWLAYHVNGTGIQKVAKALPLVFGAAFHEGCEDMLVGNVEAAVLRAKLFLSVVFEEKGVSFGEEKPNDAAWQYGMEEQAAMAEAMIRGFWAYEGEQFLKDFEVIEVEQEGRAQLPEGITLMFRPDSLVRERLTRDLYIVSWKTCATFVEKTTKQASVDMQSVSEVWGRQNIRLNEFGMTSGITIEGVLYKFAVKGQRRKDKWDGIYKQSTHLIYGWRKVSGTDEDWSWSYEFPNEEDSAKESRLGKGWKKVPIWREYPGGVKAWIEALSRNEIFPRHVNALESVFPIALPVARRADELETWKTQIVSQENKVRNAVRIMELTPPAEFEEQLDKVFPQHTARCFDYGNCSMLEACWTQAVKQDPIASGLYQIRTKTNHPEKSEDND